MPTVFVTNLASDHDYSSALVYGTLRPITNGNYPIYKTGRLIEEITEVVVQTDPEDFLLISGSSAVAALCMAIWLQRHDKCKILIWDRSPRSYVTRVIDRAHIRMGLEKANTKWEDRLNADSVRR